MTGCLALNGKLGTNPYRLNRVLKNYPIQFTRYKALSKLEAALAPGDTAILCIWNDKNDLRKGAHFFTAIRQPKGYAVYNRLAPLPEPCSLASIIGKGKLIISYRLF